MRNANQGPGIWRGVPIAAVLAALLGLLAACGSDDPTATPTPRPADTSPAPTSDATGAPDTPAKAAWEIEWEETVVKAQEEGELSLAMSSGTTREFRPVYKAFQDEFSIRMILSGGSGRQSAERILAERAVGLYTVDIVQAGATTSLQRLLPNDVLAPVEPLLFRADILDKSVWLENRFWWADPQHKYVFVYGASHNNPGITINTDLINEDDIKSYWDILDPKYNGLHVSGDLADAGGSSTFHFLFGHPDLGPEFLTRYALETDLTVINSARIAASWIVEGTKAIGMHLGSAFSTLTDDLEKRGSPLKQLTDPMIEGSSLSISGRSQIMVLNNAPHPNAQKLFINWMLSPTGQLAIQHIDSPNYDIDSLRIDIPKDMVAEADRRRVGVQYISAATDPEYQALVPESVAFAVDLAAKHRAAQ